MLVLCTVGWLLISISFLASAAAVAATLAASLASSTAFSSSWDVKHRGGSWGFHPPNGLFTGNSIKIDDLGLPYFRKPPTLQDRRIFFWQSSCLSNFISSYLTLSGQICFVSPQSVQTPQLTLSPVTFSPVYWCLPHLISSWKNHLILDHFFLSPLLFSAHLIRSHLVFSSYVLTSFSLIYSSVTLDSNTIYNAILQNIAAACSKAAPKPAARFWKGK